MWRSEDVTVLWRYGKDSRHNAEYAALCISPTWLAAACNNMLMLKVFKSLQKNKNFCNLLQTFTSFCSIYSNLARSANLPEGLYILPSVSFFFYISFLMISRRQIISTSTGPIFAIFTSNESILAVDDRSGPLFSISQGTLPWQPILCKNCLPPCTYGFGIQKRYGLSSCGWTH